MSARVLLGAMGTAVIFSCSVGVGELCGDVDQCPQGLICTRPSLADGGTAPRGVCDYPLRAEGEPCLAANQCETSLTCSNHFEPGGHYGTCVPRLPAGEACFVNRDCQSNRCTGASGQALDGTCG